MTANASARPCASNRWVDWKRDDSAPGGFLLASLAAFDVGAKVEIYKLMNELVRKGVSILMISSELPEVLGMCDRILVMHEGRLAGELKRGEATQEAVMQIATGSLLKHNVA